MTVVVPEHLKCPLSLELFRDPVCFSNDYEGHCFERDYAERVLQSNRPTNPITREHLSENVFLITNRIVKHAIEDFLNQHPDFTPAGWRSRNEIHIHADHIEILDWLKDHSSKMSLSNEWLTEDYTKLPGIRFKNRYIVKLEHPLFPTEALHYIEKLTKTLKPEQNTQHTGDNTTTCSTANSATNSTNDRDISADSYEVSARRAPPRYWCSRRRRNYIENPIIRPCHRIG